MIGLFVRGAVQGSDDLLFDQLAKTLQRVVRFDTVDQGQQPGAVDKGRQTLDLQVQGGFLAIFTRQHELAETSYGRAIA
ncbi:hypothetical protein D3C78_1564600 [compost metagenome]